jgi:two-component system LytT family sensor kinase
LNLQRRDHLTLSHGKPPRRWLQYGLVLLIWTFLGVFLASQAYLVLQSAARAKPDLPTQIPAASWFELLRLSLAECYIWGVLALGIFWLARQFPFSLRMWWLSLPAHLVASVLLAFVESALSVLASEWLRHDIPKPTINVKVLQFFFLAKLHQNILFYWVILGVCQAVDYYRKYRDRDLRAFYLEAQLAQAQLQVLKMQMHPHFLFNTLHAISALVHQDVDVADRMIARLGDLLRSTLENANKQEVPLKQELDFIRPYLEIEQARLGPRLTVQMAIEPNTMDAYVPNLLLQPLVENAIRHGIAPRSEPGRIDIQVKRNAEMLQVQVRDDGPGLAGGDQPPIKEGVGLANTRARLQQLYGADHRFELANGLSQGLTVTVVIPFRESITDQVLERPGNEREDPNPDCG